MKVAFAGKGGVGKTTLVALLVRVLADKKKRVLAIDADPNSNLARALGFPDAEKIRPIVEMKGMIYERMEIKGDPRGSFYKLNPKIDDIPGKFVKRNGAVYLIVMGTVDSGGSGCVCPESTFLKELLKHLMVARDENIVMDMEAGIEHLGRSTASSMDCLLAVVEPTATSVETANRIRGLAADFKLKTYFVGNKIRSEEDKVYLGVKLGRDAVLGMVPYYESMQRIDKDGSIMDIPDGSAPMLETAKILEVLLEMEMNDEQKKVAG